MPRKKLAAPAKAGALDPDPPDREWLPAPRNWAEAKEIADMLCQSQMCPKAYRGRPMDVLIAVDHGKRLGLPPLTAMNNIAVINGKPSLYGDGLLAVVRSHPEFEDMREGLSKDRTTAWCEIKRRGQTPVQRKFTVAEARRAGLWGKDGPWKSYPERMLQMRARGWAGRDAFPDALLGLVLEEEARDMVPPGPATIIEEPRDLAEGETPQQSTRDIQILSRLATAQKIDPVKQEDGSLPESPDLNEEELASWEEPASWEKRMGEDS